MKKNILNHKSVILIVFGPVEKALLALMAKHFNCPSRSQIETKLRLASYTEFVTEPGSDQDKGLYWKQVATKQLISTQHDIYSKILFGPAVEEIFSYWLNRVNHSSQGNK